MNDNVVFIKRWFQNRTNILHMDIWPLLTSPEVNARVTYSVQAKEKPTFSIVHNMK